MNDIMNKQHKYFGFQIHDSPYSEEFQKSCLRAPDFIYEVRTLKTHSCSRWLVFWRSYENYRSERGLVVKDGWEVEIDNCLSFLPLSIVMFALADGGMLEQSCSRFFSIVPHAADHKSKCDLPAINLNFLRSRLSFEAGCSFRMDVCTLRHLKSLYRRKELVASPSWEVPNEIIEKYAYSIFSRAAYIASIIHDERSFQCLLPVYWELSYYGGLLFGYFEEINYHASEEFERARVSFRNVFFQQWYVGSEHQRKTYPSGLARYSADDMKRYVLHDFQPGRRLKYRESDEGAYITECGDEPDALYFDAAKSRHILPENATPFLTYEPTGESIGSLP